jgi:D-tyrosyl-tRNA(Tyr) deacylase
VSVDGVVVGAIDRPGIVALVGVTHDDTPAQADTIARKIAELRILRDERSALDDGAPVLVISQFTLYGDARKGRRPSWSAAAPGPVADADSKQHQHPGADLGDVLPLDVDGGLADPLDQRPQTGSTSRPSRASISERAS